MHILNMKCKRFAILCNDDSDQITDRLELVDYLHALKIQPYVAGVDTGETNGYYSKENALFLPIAASRNNTNPFKEIKSIISVAKQMKKNTIDSVIIYGVKNHGAMAIGSYFGGVKRILCVVNGSGNLFRVTGIKGTIVRLMAFPVLRCAYKISKAVCFQNEDDRGLFLRRRLINDKTNIFFTGGSGVNLSLFSKTILPKENRFLFLARITRSKGICEYIEAAHVVKRRYPDAVFDIVGPIDDTIEHEGFNSILKSAIENGIVQYYGPTDDVPLWMSKCRYFVYPSYYPEGVPRCSMQAIATGRPIITCDTPGCKETVVDGVNGFLIADKDSTILAEKMIWMIEHPCEVEKMADASRKIAEEKFDVLKINKKIVDELLKENV